MTHKWVHSMCPELIVLRLLSWELTRVENSIMSSGEAFSVTVSNPLPEYILKLCSFSIWSTFTPCKIKDCQKCRTESISINLEFWCTDNIKIEENCCTSKNRRDFKASWLLLVEYWYSATAICLRERHHWSVLFWSGQSCIVISAAKEVIQIWLTFPWFSANLWIQVNVPNIYL